MDLREFRIFVEPQQGATYDTQLAVARAAEQLGFGAFFRSDHYLKMGDVSGLPGPTDAWITLAGLARETTTIRLGTLVTAATFRFPGPLAISVAEVDQMSGGRIELGLGAGWYAEEHRAYAIPFPDLADRFDLLAEQLEVLTGLWTTPVGETYSFAGSRYQVDSSPGLPKPAQAPHPPIIIGGHGRRRTPALAARFAAEINVPFAGIEPVTSQVGRVRAACEAIGRDPETVTGSATLVTCVGATPAELERRAATIGRAPDELRANGIAGVGDEIVPLLHRWADAGIKRIYLQILDPTDLDHLELLAATITTA